MKKTNASRVKTKSTVGSTRAALRTYRRALTALDKLSPTMQQTVMTALNAAFPSPENEK